MPGSPGAPRYEPKCELPEHANYAPLLEAAMAALADMETLMRRNGLGLPSERQLRAAIAQATPEGRST